MKRLAIISTHPIQYNAPLFRLLSQRSHIAIKVFYTWGQSKEVVYDAKFGITRSWDVPLLEGYDSSFVDNSSRKPDSNRFWGVINPGLIKQIKDEKFDALLVYRWSVWSHFLLLQYFGKKPALFFRGDSHLLQEKPGFQFYLKMMVLRFIYRNVKKAFVVGKHNADYMLACGLGTDQLTKAPHAIDLFRFSSEAPRLEDIALKERISMGIPQDSIVFLYAGKFYELKDLHLLIQTFMCLKGEQYRLLLIGQGEQEQELKRLAENDNRILFMPFRNQTVMPVIYRIGDVFVLPSKSETWGLGVNEAMACSRAAIVSDACGCASDLIVEGETGYVFKTNNGTDLLRCLQLMNTKHAVEEMGAFAFEHIQHFSLEAVAEAIENEVLALD
jgi:glycosyltransferase involved in cell wall biosynthesis